MPNDSDASLDSEPTAATAPAIDGVQTAIAAFVGQTGHGPVAEPVEVNSVAAFATHFGEGSGDTPLSFSVQQFFENGGERAIVVRVQPGRGQPLRDEDLMPAEGLATGRGIYAFEKADLFNLLVIPPLDWAVDVAPSIWAGAAAYCLRRRALLIIDAPIQVARSGVEAGKAGLKSLSAVGLLDDPAAANVAMYFPRLLAQVGGSSRQIAASGAIAGVIARTDRTRGVWTAPAGIETTLQGVSGLSHTLNASENGELNRLGINCLRTFPGQGPVIWGARTLHGNDERASDWKYIPVRRLALHIEESIVRGTAWAVSEPNDEALWSRICLAVGNYLLDLFRQGAFQGRTPDNAFFVRCDSTTTTQADIDNGIVNILVGFAPLKPAEFVIIRIQLQAGNR